MRIRNQKDFWAGVMFFIAGAAFLIGALDHDFGTSRRMGPAYLPAILGGLLALLGLIIACNGVAPRKQADGLEPMRFGPMGWILGSVVLFAIVLKPLGLLLTIVLVVGSSMRGASEFRWKEAAVVSAVMLALAWGVFIRGLELPIPMLPWFLER